MPTDPRDDESRARHDQRHQAPGRDAWFQGSRVRLDLNVQAAVQLRDALDGIARSEPSSGAALGPGWTCACPTAARCESRSG